MRAMIMKIRKNIFKLPVATSSHPYILRLVSTHFKHPKKAGGREQ
jgi:hypothetical protein